MSKITKFENLDCWMASRQLVNYIYDLTEKPDLKNQFTIKNQMERAGLSVMNNIAEGFGRFHNLDFIRFLNIATSSCCEIKSMSYLLLDRNKIDQTTLEIFHKKIDSAYFLTLGFIKYLKSNQKK